MLVAVRLPSSPSPKAVPKALYRDRWRSSQGLRSSGWIRPVQSFPGTCDTPRSDRQRTPASTLASGEVHVPAGPTRNAVSPTRHLSSLAERSSGHTRVYRAGGRPRLRPTSPAQTGTPPENSRSPSQNFAGYGRYSSPPASGMVSARFARGRRTFGSAVVGPGAALSAHPRGFPPRVFAPREKQCDPAPVKDPYQPAGE